jgi:aryl-alcohol dehydrogenase-like predicted oxidoreductase
MDAFRAGGSLHTNQPPFNLFERGIEDDVLPYCIEHDVTTLTYGALCRGLLTGKFSKDADFEGDDLRQNDPKFADDARFAQYLDAVERLDQYARDHYGKEVIHLAVRWLLDRPGVGIALWGARIPSQLDAIDEVFGWSLGEDDFEAIDAILDECIDDPVGPEFMAPPAREQ